jgi:hypothetical protein
VYRPEKGYVPVLLKEIEGEGVIVTRDEVKKYVDEVFFHYYNIFLISSFWGLPNGSIGWGNEPSDIVQALTAFKLEQNAIEAEQIEESKDGRSN